MARIYRTLTMGEAHIRVAIVSREEADLWVRKVSSWGMAQGDALWFITSDKQDANRWLFFTSPAFAQIRICFVDNYGEAGWQKESPYKGKLG